MSGLTQAEWLRISEKIHRLLSLTESSNEHESRNAALHVCRLIRAHCGLIPREELEAEPLKISRERARQARAYAPGDFLADMIADEMRKVADVMSPGKGQTWDKERRVWKQVKK